MADTTLQQTPFSKQLAASGNAAHISQRNYEDYSNTRSPNADRATRDKAVASLRFFLSTQRQFTKLDFLKLWKGLFYCMWLSDRPRTQQRLVADLADLVSLIEEKNVVLYLESFWITIIREWNAIDVLRMDKFLLLVRSYLAASFRYLVARRWEKGIMRRFVDLLRENPLSTKDQKVPNGLRYHLIDIYVDELEKLKPEEMKSYPLPLRELLQPFEELIVGSPTMPIRKRSKELLSDERLAQWGYRGAVGTTKSKQMPEERDKGGEAERDGDSDDNEVHDMDDDEEEEEEEEDSEVYDLGDDEEGSEVYDVGDDEDEESE